MTLRIRMLGGLLLEGSGRVLPQIPTRGARSLFAYLVLNRDRDLSRDLVAGTFWPDMADSQARRRLSQSLWQIQTHLESAIDGGPWFRTTTGTVGFDATADYWLDVEEFDAIAREVKTAPLADLRRAAALYRGDLLAGEYDDWVLAESRQRREDFLNVLAQAASELKRAGAFEEALEYARRLASHEPLREESHREVMRLCYLAGRPNEALLQYEICYSVLADELGAEPEAATTQLFESIAESRTLPAPTRPHHVAPLVGRGEERAAAVAMLEAALAGKGGVLLLEGPVGIGKSRLIDTITEDATWRGMTVIGGAGESDVYRALDRGISPLQAEQLGSLVEPVWLDRLAARVPSVSSGAQPTSTPLRPAEELAGALEAFAQAVIGLSRLAPTLLILDDFDQATVETRDSLAYLSGRIAGEPAVILLTLTDPRGTPDVWDAVRRIDGMPHTTRISLSPLSRTETDELLRATSAVDRADIAGRLHDETGGNPLFLVETIRARQEQAVSDPNLPHAGYEIPASVGAAIRRRLGGLGELDRALLGALAVLETESSPDWIAAVAEIGPAEAAHQLGELSRRGLLIQGDGGFGFVHDQVRELIYRELTDAPALHGRAAEVLQNAFAGTSGVDRGAEQAPVIARHLAEAGEKRAAADWYLRAAEHSSSVAAFASAADGFRTALELGLDSTGRHRALTGLETALDVLGHRAEQESAILELVEDGDTEALIRLAWLRANTDDFEGARAAAQRALDESPLAAPEAYRVLGMVGLWSGNTQEAVTRLGKAAELAKGAQRATAAEALGRALSAAGRYEEASEQTERALGLFAAAEDRRGQAEALGSLGIIAMERGHVGESIDYYERAIGVCQAIGYLYGEGVNLVNLANAQWTAGLIAGALTSYDGALDVFGTLNHRRGRAVVSANAATAHLTIGDFQTAAGLCARAGDYFESVDNRDGLAQVLTTQAEIELEQSEVSSARTSIDLALERISETGNRWLEIQALRILASVEIADGNPDRAVTISDRALKLAIEYPDFTPALLSLGARARMEAGDTKAALEQSRQAVDGVPENSTDALTVMSAHAEILDRAGEPTAGAYFAASRDIMEVLFAGLTEEQQARAHARYSGIEHASEHTLVRADVPTGRPLTEDDFTQVTWNLLTTAEAQISDASSRRQAQIVRLVESAADQGAAVRIDDLAEALDVGVRTIRRDIDALRKAGVTIVTRGARFTNS